MAWEPGNPNDRSVKGFRTRHGTSRGPMSKSTYNRLPDKPRVNALGQISRAVEAAWDKAQDNPTGKRKKAVEARAKWRHERAVKAARAAAASPLHVSKQGPRKKKPDDDRVTR